MIFFVEISLKFDPRDPIDSKPVLAQEMFRQGTDIICHYQVIIWSNAYPVCWCIYVALGGDGLIH